MTIKLGKTCSFGLLCVCFVTLLSICVCAFFPLCCKGGMLDWLF